MTTILPNNRLNPKLTRRQSAVLLNKSRDENDGESKVITGVTNLIEKSIPLDGKNKNKFKNDDDIHDDGIIYTETKKDPYSSSNVPMLFVWLSKSYDELPSAISGLEFILKHCQSGQGCVICMKHGVLEIITEIINYEKYHYNMKVQLLSLQIFQRLLECHYTRDYLTYKTDVLNLTFRITHRFMSHINHVIAGMNCILQCSRSEICRSEIIELKIIGYCINFCKRHSKSPDVIRPVLRLFTWISITIERLTNICNLGAIEACLQCMKRHTGNAKVLAAGMTFLTHAANTSTLCMNEILSKKAVPMIIKSLRALHYEGELQIQGLKMLQTLSTTEEGYFQISETRGGWQSVCQGKYSR